MGGTVALTEHTALDLIDSGSRLSGVSLVNTVPSIARELLDHNALPRTATTINLADEALAPDLVQRLHQQPHVRAVNNLYGPSTKPGHRIELGEVRNTLLSHNDVAESAVGLHGDHLVAHVSPVLDEQEIRAHLAASLPRQLVPRFFVFLDQLPHTPDGKIDHNALPAPATPASWSSTPPRTEVERTLADVWREVLEVPEVGVHDDFSTHGGHSLLAVRDVDRIRAAACSCRCASSSSGRPSLSRPWRWKARL
ncbi:non-ribosomal peptide synthetase [Lentzea jiangxiensis]|nr:non-ribosomal peptide synthetase [Lentzea jiangxiensis]